MSLTVKSTYKRLLKFWIIIKKFSVPYMTNADYQYAEIYTKVPISDQQTLNPRDLNFKQLISDNCLPKPSFLDSNETIV